MTFISLTSGRRKIKKALSVAEQELHTLQDRVRSLEENNRVLTAQVADYKQKTALADEHSRCRDTGGGEGASTSSSIGAEKKQSIYEHWISSSQAHGETEKKVPASTPSTDVVESQLQMTDNINNIMSATQSQELHETDGASTAVEVNVKNLWDEPTGETDTETLDNSNRLASDCYDDAVGDLQKTIALLKKRNKTLEANAISLSREKVKLEQRIGKTAVDIVLASTEPGTEQQTPSVEGEKKGDIDISLCETSHARDEKMEDNIKDVSFETVQSTTAGSAKGGETLRTQMSMEELIKQNAELEANLTILTEKNSKLTSRLANEKNKTQMRKSESKKRRQKLKGRLADMSSKLREDFGEDFEAFSSNNNSADEKSDDTGDVGNKVEDVIESTFLEEDGRCLLFRESTDLKKKVEFIETVIQGEFDERAEAGADDDNSKDDVIESTLYFEKSRDLNVSVISDDILESERGRDLNVSVVSDDSH